jgi:hypothetical protein
MHLSHNETPRLGGGRPADIQSSVPGCNGNSTKRIGQNYPHTNGVSLQVNEVLISTPPTVVEAVIVGWVLLLQRYQRDAFHTFTWGLGDAKDAILQSFPATDLELSRLSTVADLLATVRRVKSKDLDVEGSTTATLVLLDGTQEEVRNLAH